MESTHKKIFSFASALLLTCAAVPAAPLPAAAYLRGDVSGDGEIKAEDAQRTLEAFTQIMTGQESPFNADEAKAADVDFNGKIEAADAQYILLYYTANTVSGVLTQWYDVIESERPANKIPDADETLTILCWANSDVEKMTEHFEAAHPEYKGRVQYAMPADYSAQAREKYPKYLESAEDADIIFVEGDYLRQFADDNRYTLPISDLGFKESDFNKCFDYTKEVGRDQNGVLRGVSATAYPGGYVYRTDLAEKYLGAKSPEEMQTKVDSWEHFAESAEIVKQASGGKTAMTATMYGMMFPWMSQRTLPWLDENGTLQITGNDLAYLERCKSYWNSGYISQADEWYDAWYEAGQNDSTMGYFAASWWLLDDGVLSRAEGGTNGSTYGKYAITEGPNAYYWGGTWMLLTKKCNSGTIAHDFIEHFTVNTETMKSYAEQYGEFVNNEIAMQSVTRSNPYLGGANEIPVLLRQAKAVDLSSVRGPYDEDLCWDFLTAAKKYAQNDMNIEETLRYFKKLAVEEHPDIKLG